MIEYRPRRQNDGVMVCCNNGPMVAQLAHLSGRGVYLWCKICHEEHFIPEEQLASQIAVLRNPQPILANRARGVLELP